MATFFSYSDLAKSLKAVAGTLTSVLDELDNLLESIPHVSPRFIAHSSALYILRKVGIAHALIQKTLATRHHCALTPKARQCDRNLLLIAAADGIGDDVDLVAFFQKVQSRLCDLRLLNSRFDVACKRRAVRRCEIRCQRSRKRASSRK